MNEKWVFLILILQQLHSSLSLASFFIIIFFKILVTFALIERMLYV